MNGLPRRSIVVTGASSGIGEAVVLAALEDPTIRVVGLDLVAPGRATISTPNRFVFGVCDVSDPTSVASAIETLESSEAPYAGLVNSAGNHASGPSLDLSISDWSSVLAVHLTGTFITCQAVAKRMTNGGSIVNLSSIAQDFGLPGRAAYCSAKAGIAGLTRVLAAEWAPLGIRVNAVAPGYVDTPMGMKGVTDRRGTEALHALGRFAQPAEIATVICFLLSDASSFITGEVIRADGGYSIVKTVT